MKMLLFYKGKKYKDIRKMFLAYFFFLLDDVKLFLALVDMNYLIVISVNITMEANYFAVFIFSSNRKKNNWL